MNLEKFFRNFREMLQDFWRKASRKKNRASRKNSKSSASREMLQQNKKRDEFCIFAYRVKTGRPKITFAITLLEACFER